MSALSKFFGSSDPDEVPDTLEDILGTLPEDEVEPGKDEGDAQSAPGSDG